MKIATFIVHVFVKISKSINNRKLSKFAKLSKTTIYTSVSTSDTTSI